MLLQVVAGLFVGSINIVIHAWLTVATIRVVRGAAEKRRGHPWLHLVGVMIATVLLLMAISQRFKTRGVRIALLAIASIMLCFPVYRIIFSLPRA